MKYATNIEKDDFRRLETCSFQRNKNKRVIKPSMKRVSILNCYQLIQIYIYIIYIHTYTYKKVIPHKRIWRRKELAWLFKLWEISLMEIDSSTEHNTLDTEGDWCLWPIAPIYLSGRRPRQGFAPPPGSHTRHAPLWSLARIPALISLPQHPAP